MLGGDERTRWTVAGLASVALGLLLVPAVARLPVQWTLAGARQPTVATRGNPEAELQRRVGSAVDVALLEAADRRLPRDARVVVITPGRDPRRTEYVAFHRVRYWLTPRPTWWMTSAPRDGTSESRWWIPDPLTPASIAAFAAARGITHALVLDAGVPPDLGERLVARPRGRLLALAGAPITPPASPAFKPSWSAPPVWPALGAAVLGILVPGLAVRLAIGPASRRVVSPHLWADAWWLGSIVLTVGAFWLDRFGIAPSTHRIGFAAIGTCALLAVIGLRRARRDEWPPAARVEAPVRVRWPLPGTIRWLAVVLIALNLAFVGALVLGHPLEAWDSWAHWAARARGIFRQEGLGPAVFTDPTGQDPHLYYPLGFPLRHAWVFGWLDAPDDRWVSVLTLLDYVALMTILGRALHGTRAVLVSVAVAGAIFPLAAGAGNGMADVTLALLAMAAVAHTAQWARFGVRGHLALAALAVGGLAWFKVEGAVLAAVTMAGVTVCVRPAHRAVSGVVAMAIAVGAIAVPWWWQRPDVPPGVADFSPLTLASVVAGLDRAWPIARQAARILVDPLLGFVWPVAGLVVARQLAGGREPPGRHPGAPHLPLVVAGTYAAVMALPYLVSAYAPLEAHVRNSYYRLAAQVTPLLLLWLGARAAGEEDR